MWEYQKALQFPINIKNPNPKLAAFVVSQYGGPDGELAASLRYLSQRYAMRDDVVKGILTDIGTEELGHLEMVGSIVHQLTRCATTGEIEKSPMAPYFIDNGRGVFPTSAPGFPFSASSIASKSDIIANLVEDLAAEQKARAVYDNILRVSDDPDVNQVIKFLRQREITHFQRFGEALDHVQNNMKCKKCM
ncbi:MAG: manganese catalase family protein [Eubacteriales bacterium]|nr:manganese catalase family protein [Eubacteriales bacterium]